MPEKVKLYDGYNDEIVWFYDTQEDAIDGITKFLRENCTGDWGISDLEIDMNFREFDTLDKQCEHYNFYWCYSNG